MRAAALELHHPIQAAVALEVTALHLEKRRSAVADQALIE